MATDNLTAVRTFRYRLRLTKKQHETFNAILEQQRQLYNELLGWKQFAWDVYKADISEYDFYTWLTVKRQEPAFASLPANLQRATIARLIRAFQSFFRRCRAGQKPGYPRFKGQDWFKSFSFKEFVGIRLNGGKLKFKGCPGTVRVNLHRQLPGTPIACAFRRDRKGWLVSFQVKVAVPEKQEVCGKPIGVDVGLTSLATLSTGEAVGNRRYGSQSATKLRIAQRALARCHRGSVRRQKAKAAVIEVYEKIQNQRETYLHQVSADFVRRFDFIAIENLNVKGLAGGILPRQVHDAAWSRLRFMLEYKAENAGTHVIAVNPCGTSQECSNCGKVVKKDLTVRTHECSCGLVLGRDHNAALNILHRAVVSPGAPKVAGYGKLALGNTVLEISGLKAG